MDVQRTGRIFGSFFIGTFVTSIPARLLFLHGLGASRDDVRSSRARVTQPLEDRRDPEFGLVVTNIAARRRDLPAREATE